MRFHGKLWERLDDKGRRTAVVALLSLLATTIAADPASASPPAQAPQQLQHTAGPPTWPANPDWQSLVPGPSTDEVKPVRITRTHGSVTNPQALVDGNGITVLTMEPGGSPAIVVLDYGREVGGTPYATVSASTPASNNLRISTSEALPFLNANTTTTLAREANASDANVKVVSAAPFYVGSPITLGSGVGV